MIAGRMAGAALSAAFVLGIAVELIEAARGNAPPERPTMSPVPGGTIMTNPYLLKEGETKEIPLGTLKMEGGTLYLNGIPQQG